MSGANNRNNTIRLIPPKGLVFTDPRHWRVCHPGIKIPLLTGAVVRLLRVVRPLTTTIVRRSDERKFIRVGGARDFVSQAGTAPAF